MESLEPRNLLSLSLSILDGVDGESVAVRIAGNEADDFIWVQYDWVAQQVTLNPFGECIAFDASVKQIIVDAGDGDDVVHVRGGGGAIQFIVDGGPGNDTLTGSNGHDWIAGGEGDDWITGALGADYLAGGPGDDSLFGGNGGDLLSGGDGADQLWGGRGRDVLDLDGFDLVALGEETLADLASATPPQTIDPNEVVTPLCPPECPPGWEL